jgi:acyl dehydratase
VGEYTISQLGERLGQELGVSDWVTIDQSRIDAFAACTGDHQWILPKDAAAGLNYGVDRARFLAPVSAGARVRLRVVLTGAEPKEGGQAIMKTRSTLEVEGSDKPALVAETLAFLIPARKA